MFLYLALFISVFDLTNYYFYQDDSPVDTEYAAQISKSLGRLGYNRESDKRLARPPVQFGGEANDTVPPPALFSTSMADSNTDSGNTELYGAVHKKVTI